MDAVENILLQQANCTNVTAKGHPNPGTIQMVGEWRVRPHQLQLPTIQTPRGHVPLHLQGWEGVQGDWELRHWPLFSERCYAL